MEATTTAIIATNTILNTIGVTSNYYPAWVTPPLLFEMIGVMVLGYVAVLAREVHRHYSDDSPYTTSWKRCLAMFFPGIFSGLLGGEIAAMAGFAPTDMTDPSWLFVLAIGYGGAPIVENLVQAISGILIKALEKFGMDYERQSAQKLKVIEEDEKRYNEMRRTYEDKQFEQALDELGDLEEHEKSKPFHEE